MILATYYLNQFKFVCGRRQFLQVNDESRENKNNLALSFLVIIFRSYEWVLAYQVKLFDRLFGVLWVEAELGCVLAGKVGARS